MASSDLLRGRHTHHVPNVDGHGTDLIKRSLVCFLIIQFLGLLRMCAYNVPNIDGHQC